MSLAPFPKFLGMKLEEVRLDYGRILLPFRPELNQPAGMVHGGASASSMRLSHAQSQAMIGARHSPFVRLTPAPSGLCMMHSKVPAATPPAPSHTLTVMVTSASCRWGV